MSQKITKAVFPVAGLGTRFLPATKAIPKEMLPVVDKPLIQYAVEEAVAAGIDTMIFVSSRSKNEGELLKLLKDIVPPNVSFVFIRQAEALGLGHAVYCARPVIGDEPFAVILADDMVEDGARGCMAQMVELYKHKKTSILGVERINPSDTASYGIVKTPATTDKYSPIELIVEKPKPEVAPSNLAVVGRYILTPAIFEKLKNTGRGAGGEIQLTDAIADLLDDEIVLAYEFEGTRYDCGSKLGFLIANVEMALLHNELKDNFSSYLRNLIKSDKL